MPARSSKFSRQNRTILKTVKNCQKGENVCFLCVYFIFSRSVFHKCGWIYIPGKPWRIFCGFEFWRTRTTRKSFVFGKQRNVDRILTVIVDKQTWSLAKSEELTKKYILSGVHPYITFRNKTWWKTYKFQRKEITSNFRWHLQIQRDVFTEGKIFVC